MSQLHGIILRDKQRNLLDYLSSAGDLAAPGFAAAAAMELETAMIEEVVALAGEGYDEVHTVTFQPHGSGMEEQFENLGEVLGAGLDDVEEMARAMAESAEAEIVDQE